MIHPLKITRAEMLWGDQASAITEFRRVVGGIAFTATPDGLAGSRVVIDVRAGKFIIDGIEMGLRGWHKTGEGSAEAETVDPPGGSWADAEAEQHGPA